MDVEAPAQEDREETFKSWEGSLKLGMLRKGFGVVQERLLDIPRAKKNNQTARKTNRAYWQGKKKKIRQAKSRKEESASPGQLAFKRLKKTKPDKKEKKKQTNKTKKKKKEKKKKPQHKPTTTKQKKKKNKKETKIHTTLPRTVPNQGLDRGGLSLALATEGPN